MSTSASQTSAVLSGVDTDELSGSVLVCGGGIAGIQSALDLSAGGFHVYLVEEGPAIGGNMARLDKTFPTGDCATCTISPKLVACLRDLNIEVLTMADVVDLDGEPGHFKATVRKHPRYVDMEKCTACGDCSEVCPVSYPNPREYGMTMRKAVDQPYLQSAPNSFVIRKEGRGACSGGCPIDSSVQAYVALIADGRFQEAADVIRRENPLPAICGRVCFHPCEAECNRGRLDDPVNIRDLKRFAIETCPQPEVSVKVQSSGKSVAVVGSGPAGLAAAHSLAHAGHAVTVFESLPVVGGMLAVGIPDYRLPPDILERDVDLIRQIGVEFKMETTVGKDVSVEDLTNGHDALFVATGAHESRKLGVPGEECEQVVHGVDFLREFTLTGTASVGRRTIVVGGGNTAIDAARTALRAGAEEVTILYRRSREEMPADEAEIVAALEEGVQIHYLAAPTEVVLQDGHMTAVACVEMELGPRDSSGRRRPVPIEGSEFTIEADTLIPAVSQSPESRIAEALELRVTRWGTIKTDETTLATSRAGVFAGGDVVLGPASVIDAIACGKRAAQAIDNFLTGRPANEGLTADGPSPEQLSAEKMGEKRRSTHSEPRVRPAEADPDERRRDFREVEHMYTAEEAKAEASRCLNCGVCSECMLCVDACKAKAIMHGQKEELVTLDVGAVLLSPGYQLFNATRLLEFGTAFDQNVLTNIQYERVLSASGPTQGHIRRPSDGSTPKRLAFIQCIGSRDAHCGNDYCSSVCCMAATKEAIQSKDHEPDLDVTIFFMDLRAFGKDFERYYQRAQDMGIRYVRCRPSSVEEIRGTRNLAISYIDAGNHSQTEEFDMVVLSLGLEPSATLKEQADRLGVMLNDWGFCRTRDLAPLDTSRPGVFVTGAMQEPKDIPDTVMQASAAAARVMALLAPARGTCVKTKAYPAERDITDEPPRVGVFICHCGSNIASVVDVGEVCERARRLPFVVLAEHNVYTCADDTQDLMKEKIIEHRLNRVVVASCTPRTHEAIFRDTLRDAGLNPYLLEMANIRDQCSWVHSGSPDQATNKANDLVRMTVGRTSALRPLSEETVPVKSQALVIGGGVAGMTASLAMADAGTPVHLVEKTSELGGIARDLRRTLDGSDVQDFVEETIQRVMAHKRVKVYTDSKVTKVDGHVGDFTSDIATGGDTVEIEHGVVVVATGAQEHRPVSYGYSDGSNGVITQLELGKRLADGDLDLPEDATVAMIQCVEQRDKERPYCSRVCCSTAVQNAILLRERMPKAKIFVLYRDMRTYGFREAAYKEARAKGVVFVRYNEDRPPEFSANGKMTLRVQEPTLGRDLEMNPDLLVLAVPMVARDDRQDVSDLLRVPLNADGFFLEAHVKLRPVDFASEGLFLCGTAHAPKSLTETISQANAVAGRAASILSRKVMPVGAQTAWVDSSKCISCMTCVHVCPYLAPRVGKDNKADVQATVCMGCGSCTAACPAKAITLHNYVDTQILGAINALLGRETEDQPMEAHYPEETGIADPRWHKK